MNVNSFQSKKTSVQASAVADLTVSLSINLFRIYFCFFTGWLYESSGSYHQAFFVCGSVAIVSSILVFIVSRLDRNQRRRYTFRKRLSKTPDPSATCVCEESVETGSEMSALVEMTSREVLIVTDKETVL